MNTTSNLSRRNVIWLTIAVFAISAASSVNVHAQVRTKKPDRGVYQPGGSTLYPKPDSTKTIGGQPVSQPSSSDPEDDRGRTPAVIKPIRIEPLRVDSPKLHELEDPRSVQLESVNEIQRVSYAEPSATRPTAPIGRAISTNRTAATNRVASTNRTWIPRHDDRHVPMGDETLIQHETILSGESWVDEEPYPIHGDHFGGCGSCDGGCDGYGCDGYPYDGFGHHGYGHHSNGSLCLDPCRWFGSLELLLLWREGDRIPPLVTTSPGNTPIATAGRLPAATILAGGENIFDEITAGGRLTIGTWIDSCHNRSIVGRLWTATEEDYSFGRRESINSGNILAIPTTTGGTPNAVIVAFPNTAENAGRFGSVNVSASSNVYGADVSVRQFWTGGLGTTYDVLYGYQFMRLDEDLSLQTSSTITQQQLPLEVGNNLTSLDEFDTRNEFHGGQFGLAGRYREGCWSFDFLAKVGFGQLTREVERRGRTIITTDTPPPGDTPTGILVTDDNRGLINDSTFGWVPELDVSVGWHKYPRFDVTFGYNLIALTDAVRLSGVMDPDNTTDTPQAGIRGDTFYLQGIHFGIRHVY
ncbi:BBP7 family outer membrane beta-barrel protein [Neorhodopirellula pilleata]|nr:BBP7 family outer membrane beta-barrel protein [Neorhodopirellula pilleata]